jgi:histone acetyltransferase (RNA polymerase elongator complex component)
MVVRSFSASDATEFFISVETANRDTICGFARLRLPMENSSVFPELHGCALVRELHVSGLPTSLFFLFELQ